MSKRNPLPDWAKRIGSRINQHANAVADAAELVADNPTDRKRVLKLYAEAHLVLELVDQLTNPEEEDEEKSADVKGT